MGTTKSEEFSLKDNRLSGYANALSHPARIAILKYLMKNQECICGDIVDKIPLSQSTVSQHLKELKAAGLIKGEIEGKKVCYCIDGKVWKLAEKQLREFFGEYKNTSKKICK